MGAGDEMLLLVVVVVGVATMGNIHIRYELQANKSSGKFGNPPVSCKYMWKVIIADAVRGVKWADPLAVAEKVVQKTSIRNTTQNGGFLPLKMMLTKFE